MGSHDAPVHQLPVLETHSAPGRVPASGRAVLGQLGPRQPVLSLPYVHLCLGVVLLLYRTLVCGWFFWDFSLYH